MLMAFLSSSVTVLERAVIVSWKPAASYFARPVSTTLTLRGAGHDMQKETDECMPKDTFESGLGTISSEPSDGGDDSYLDISDGSDKSDFRSEHAADTLTGAGRPHPYVASLRRLILANPHVSCEKIPLVGKCDAVPCAMHHDRSASNRL